MDLCVEFGGYMVYRCAFGGAESISKFYFVGISKKHSVLLGSES